MKYRFQVTFAVNFQPLTPEEWIQLKAYPCENCGRQGGTGLFSHHALWLSNVSIIATKLRTHLNLKLDFYQKNICEEA